jgi:hypothetical protein
MTIHAYKNAAVSALALTMLVCAAPAYAAGDYHIKFGGVDGETEGKKDGKHSDWIIIESVQLGAERTTGGVNVASGDINGDGAAATSGQATGRRTYEPITIRKRIAKTAPAPTGKTIAAPDDDQTAALLLPAVQKVRVAAARMTPWTGCAAGQKIEGMTIKQVSTGRTGRILDPVVATCAAESISFNFTKIEWK